MLDGDRQRCVDADGCELLAKQGFLAEVAHRLAVALTFYLFKAVKRVLDSSKAADQLGSAFGSNIGSLLAALASRLLARQRPRAGDVVTGIACQRQPVHYPVRRHSDDFLDLGGIAQGLGLVGAARRFQYFHTIVNQLEHVLVARDNQYIEFLPCALKRQAADDVVRFESLLFDNR